MRVTTKDKDGNITGIFNGTPDDWYNRKGTKAKQLLLESSLIAKDMEILLLKEKLEDANNDIELLKSDKIVLQSDNKYLFKRCEDHAHQKLEYACALSEEKRKHASNYNLLIEANKELDKMPNWIKWLFK